MYDLYLPLSILSASFHINVFKQFLKRRWADNSFISYINKLKYVYLNQ